MRALLLVAVGLLVGCQCLVPVDDVGFIRDSGAGGTRAPDGGSDSGSAPMHVDAGTDPGDVDAGRGLDAGRGRQDSGATFDAGVDAGSSADSGADSGGIDSGLGDGGPDSADAGSLGCVAVACPAWSICDEQAGANCVARVTNLRWLIPVEDASVPRDTIRLAVAVEITGSANSVPVVASGAGQASTVVTRTDGGLALGLLVFSALSPGALHLSAGWPNGPDAGATVHVLASNAIVLANPPNRGVNTGEYQPNDPEGAGWRRDDLVRFQGWVGAQLLARHLHPDASFVLLDAGSSSDGGQYFRLQDVEFDAFRGQVELQAKTEFWESAPQRIPVTRWRWRRVVAAPTGTLKIQQPVVQGYWPPRHLILGTQDTATSGRLIQLDQDGVATGAYSGWDAAVSTPFMSDVRALGGLDADGGFIFLEDGFNQYLRLDAPIAAAASVENALLAVTRQGRWFSFNRMSETVQEFGWCVFDGGAPLRNIAGWGVGFVVSEAGEVCTTGPYGSPQVLAARVRPMSVAGPGASALMTSASGYLLQNSTLTPSDGGPRNADFMVVERRAFASQPPPAVYAATATTLEVWPVSTDPAAPQFTSASASIPLPASLVTSPVLRRTGSRRWLFAVDSAGALRSYDAPTLQEQWAWRPDGGLQVQAPLGFAGSESLLGTLLIVADGALVAVVAEGSALARWESMDGWFMASGTSAGCHDGCYDELLLP